MGSDTLRQPLCIPTTLHHSKGFSPLLALLLEPEHGPNSKTHSALPAKGFTFFQDVLCFINVCKWFLMSVFHLTCYSSTISLQGLSFLEDHMTAINLSDRCQDPTIQTYSSYYQCLELVHNLFATLSATA